MTTEPALDLSPASDLLRAAEAAFPGVSIRLALSQEALDPAALRPRERAAFAGLPAHRRESWLRGRSALKRLLAAAGEPEETSGLEFPNARFSVSHSAGWSLAVRVEAPDLAGVGVDLELSTPPSQESARHFLTPEERAWLTSRPVAERPLERLRLWTVKESVFKADPVNRDFSLASYTIDLPGPAAGTAARRAHGGRPEHFRYVCAGFCDGFASLALCLKTKHP